MTADERLRALFAQDLPPARDLTFQAGVMEALARRRFLAEMALLSGAAVLGGVILWLLWPHLGPAVTQLSRALAPAAGCLAVVAVLLALAGVRPAAMLGLQHD